VKVDLDVERIDQIAHSPIRNYVVPGVTSWLIGERSTKGCVRMFTCERDHVEPVTPHSHRFGFHAVVLHGRVTQRLWRQKWNGDVYRSSVLKYEGDAGKYQQIPGGSEPWTFSDELYGPGDSYSMRPEELHSIYFARGTKVLVFEGPTELGHSTILEPVVDGEVCETFRVDPWMFKRDQVVKEKQA
jgi:hypothetical protein